MLARLRQRWLRGDGRAPERRCPDDDRVATGRCPVDYTNRAPTGTVNIDCCDRDRRVHPTQSIFFTIESYCGGFDFNCDGTETQQQTALAPAVRRCDYATQSACDGASDPPAWLERVPECGEGGTLLQDCFVRLAADFTHLQLHTSRRD